MNHERSARPGRVLSRTHRPASLLPALLAAALGLSACAEGVTTSPRGVDVDMSDAQDMPVIDADMGTPPEDMGVDMMPDMEVTPPSFEVCRVDGDDPWGTTCSPDQGDWALGQLSVGETRTWRVRVESTGGQPFTLNSAALADPNTPVALSVVTFDTSAPPAPTEATLPVAVAPTDAIFVELTLAGDPRTPLVEGALALELDVGLDKPVEHVIKFSVSAEGCAVGAALCDDDLGTGCETNIAGDPMNCGMCGRTCDLPDATAKCAMGACEIAACAAANLRSCDDKHETGCETDIYTNMDHCGACQRKCDFANAAETCTEGSCLFQGCTGSWADCDQNTLSNGCEVDLNTNAKHCGMCGRDCAIPNAEVECDGGNCKFLRCKPGWYDVDQNLQTNGCEYACTFVSTTDAPDDQFQDANCDGVDGDAQSGIFVAPDGSDTQGLGTRNAPFKTLTKALTIASNASGLDTVFLGEGIYQEQVYLPGGVNIAGGYRRGLGWTRSQQAVSRIRWGGSSLGRIVTMHAANISTPTKLHLLTIEAQNAANSSGDDVYAMHCKNCSQLTVERCTLIAGNAGHGDGGDNGVKGANGDPGGNGGNGSCDGSTQGYRGARGPSACGRTGGYGGQGGPEKGDPTAEAGGTGNYGTPGGTAGGGGDPGKDGGIGTDGDDGSNGADGLGGSGGSVQGDYWVGAKGQNGGNGTHGDGGGGGGGGGAQDCTLCNDGGGNGGGGGGGGGCGGTGAKGGQPGGSSFGLFLLNSDGITLRYNTIQSGRGGNGGTGGTGGAKGSGGGRGYGSSHCSSEIGEGGDGGLGGDGGRGGHGGGGAGGNSWPVYRENTTLGLPGSNTLQAGQLGNGGSSPKNSGLNGVSAPFR